MTTSSSPEAEFTLSTSAACHEDKSAYCIMMVTMVIGCFGCVLNMLSFLVYKEYPKKIAAHYYLMALAVSDTLSILFDGLVDGLDCIFGKKTLGSKTWICYADLGLDNVTTFATFWVVTLIAIDRCTGLLYPRRYKSQFSKPRIACKMLTITLAIVYVLCAVLIIGAFWSRKDGTYATDDCGQSIADGYKLFLLFGFVIVKAIVPIALTAITLVIVCEVNKYQHSSRNQSSPTAFVTNSFSGSKATSGGPSSIVIQEQMDLRNLTVVVLIVFLVLCGSAQCLTVYKHVSKKPLPVIRSLEELLYVLNSSSNFFLYCASSGMFRKELCNFFKKLRNRLKCQCHRSKGDQPVRIPAIIVNNSV